MMLVAADTRYGNRPFALLGVTLVFERAAPETAKAVNEPPVCRRSTRCEGCPYPSHGFICWGRNGECMRTDVEKIMEKEKQRKNASTHL